MQNKTLGTQNLQNRGLGQTPSLMQLVFKEINGSSF